MLLLPTDRTGITIYWLVRLPSLGRNGGSYKKKVVKRAQVTSRGGSLKNRRRLTVRQGMLFNLSVGKYATHFTVVAVEKAIGNEKRE